VLAAFLPVSAALLLIGEWLTPKGLDNQITTTKTALTMLAIAARHRDQVYISNALVIVGLGALAVSFAAIATLVRSRGATVATVAAVIGGLGYFAGAVANVWVGFNLAAATAAHLPDADAARFLVTTFNTRVGNVFLDGYILGTVVGSVLIGIALWRSRSVPRWLTVLFVIGNLVAGFAPAGIVSVPLSLPFTVAMLILALRIWQAAGGSADEAAVAPLPA